MDNIKILDNIVCYKSLSGLKTICSRTKNVNEEMKNTAAKIMLRGKDIFIFVLFKSCF